MDSKESSSQADAVLLTSPTGHGKATEASSEIIAQEACSRLLQETSMLGQLFTSSWKNMFLILTRQGEFEPAAGEAEFNLTLWSSADAAADTQGNTPFKQWELTELFDFKASKVSVSPNWLVLGMKEEHESTQIILQFANKQIRDGWM
jgi:hypothetical protein